ncbi:MAG: hybrid sensor histidine kinase/response regulator [Lachnospiraceae bacterium]
MQEYEQHSKEYLYELVLKSSLQTNREIYYVDLDADYYQMIYPNIDSTVARGCYSKSVTEKLDNGFIIDDSGCEVRDFLSINNLKKSLAIDENTEYAYCRKPRGKGPEWNLTVITVCERNPDGSAHAVTMQSINIDSTIKRERKKRKQLEETVERVERANSAKSRFLSTMSHDMRTPLNVIIGMCDIAQKYETDSVRVKDCITKINTAGRIMLTIVNEVLDIAKIENGGIELIQKEFEITKLTADVATIIRAMMSSRQQKLIFNCKHLEHKWVKGDQTRIEQVLLNIISNCVKYSDIKSTIRIAFEELEGDRPGFGNYKVVIKDHGKGMSREFIDKIFEPFTRENEKSKTPGTGLGMGIVKSIIDAMGGQITIDSTPGKGTTFTLYIPLEFAEEKPAAVADASGCDEKCSDETGRHIRVLLAEDNDMNAEIMQELLGFVGVDITVANNGMAVCDIFRNSREGEYDCIFMDIQMPGMDGFEATEVIRNMDRADKDVPIFAMTANAFTSDVEKVKEAGMQEHIAKPIEMAAVMAVLNKWFPRRLENKKR